jgi:TusA-related sulfurtransferase
MTFDATTLIPDQVFDGGDLDCGSGLILLIREHMARVPVGGILEMRSREQTVAGDLPPWCRMSGHDYLGQTVGEGCTRYFVKKGAGTEEEEKRLAEDKAEAKQYQWRLRARVTGHLKSTVYSRNFSFVVGQAASFEEKDAHPSALEYLFGALAASLTTGFASECARESLAVDDIEISLTGSLHNVLAHLGLEDGDPAVKSVEVKCFASTFDDEARVQAVWERTLRRSPLVATLAKGSEVFTKLVFV